MTKRYTILQKKLKKLESELNQVFALPPETPYHKRFAQDIQQRFLFLRNLLSAEIASRPSKPSHLQHIAQRLSELEAAFQEWDSFQTPSPDHVVEAAGSTCSCTQSCLNDDGECLADSEDQVAGATAELSLAGLGLEGFDAEERLVPVHEAEAEAERKEKEIVWGDAAAAAAAEKSSRVRKEERNGVWFGKYLGSLASGVVLGMALMAFLMVRFCGCFHYYPTDYSYCPSPT